MKIFFSRRIVLFLALVMSGSLLFAQEERDIHPVARTYAITKATIIQSPGRVIQSGTVIIKDGLIRAVGKDLSIPSDAIIVKGDSLFVYAGFIDGLSHTGATKPKEESRERPKDPGNPTPERAGITPLNDVRNSLNPTDKTIEELRAVGFTTAHVVPYGGMLSGSGSIISLGGKSADDLVLIPKFSFYSELTPAERAYPSTVIAVMAKYRELYKQAAQDKAYEALYASNRAGLEPPSPDRTLEAFYPVIDKKIPVFFRAEKILDIHRVLTLQQDLGFSLILGEVKEGWDVTGKLKASSAKVFLSLELPEEKKKDEKKPEEKKEEKKPEDASPEKQALEKRKAEFIGNYVAQAATFQRAGITFGFSVLNVKPKDIQPGLRRMIKAGLTEDQALAALTTSPAQLLGVSDRLGSIDPGKIANIVISERPYFNEKAKVKYVFVEGVQYKVESKEVKKDEAAKVDITGEWRVVGQTQQGKSESTLVISKEGNDYKGTISGGALPGQFALQEISLDGNKLKFTFTMADGLKITTDVTVEGSSFKGTAVIGEGGESIPVEGSKVPKK